MHAQTTHKLNAEAKYKRLGLESCRSEDGLGRKRAKVEMILLAGSTAELRECRGCRADTRLPRDPTRPRGLAGVT